MLENLFELHSKGSVHESDLWTPGGRGQETGTTRPAATNDEAACLPVAKRRGARPPRATGYCEMGWGSARFGSRQITTLARPGNLIGIYYEGVRTHAAAPDWRYVPLQRIALPQVSRRSNTTRCVGPCRRGPGAAVTSHGSAGLQRTQRRSASGGVRAEPVEGARRRGAALAAGAGTSRDAPFFLSFFSVSSRIFLPVRASRARVRDAGSVQSLQVSYYCCYCGRCCLPHCFWFAGRWNVGVNIRTQWSSATFFSLSFLN